LGLIGAYFLTGATRRFLLALDVVDLPNERSAHAAPVPRGGGLAVVAICGLGIALGALAGVVELNLAFGLIGGMLVVATTGWMDDLRRLSIRVRLGAHFFAALWALLWIGGYPVLHYGAGQLDLGGFGFVLALIGIIWGTNFFNFMDGIDGIVAGESLFFGIGAALLLTVTGSGDSGLVVVALVIAGASGGFLRWNWAPARIFLGDSGSTALGFLICTFAVAAENSAKIPMLAWGILLAVFVFDSTITLVRRLGGGHNWKTPHREFAFHRAVRLGWSHARVTTGVLLVNLPLAAGALAAVMIPSLLLVMVGLGLIYLSALYLWIEWRLPMASQPYVNPAFEIPAPDIYAPPIVEHHHLRPTRLRSPRRDSEVAT
jgi:Fuc2NAc and GlcNAc transferase